MKEKTDIDVLIISEGTFPYVKGGVSTWIYDLITGLEDFRFGIIFLGSKRTDYKEIQYEFPKNLVFFESYYLFEESERPAPKVIDGKKEAFDKIARLHMWFKKHLKEGLPDEVRSVDFYLNLIKEEDFLYARRAWNFIEEQYFEYAPDLPFLYYFWTVRNIHIPIWKIVNIALKSPKCKLVHSPSTGYAGFLASFIQFNKKTPFVLTEHGIYTKERKIDIMEADWIQDARWWFQREYAEIDHIRNMWINFFIGVGKLCYESANPIISLFEGARQLQISYGADPQKTIVIPNGVKIDRYAPLRQKRSEEIPKVIALIGRVVPIKDIRTFIKAIRILVIDIPDVEGWIIGPTDENPSYFEECKKLVKIFGLEKNVKFLGFKRLDEILHKVGLVTLSSISEGMPLVILEGFAAGVPAVTTDVGSCRQLVYGGLNKEDIDIGKAGEVVPISDPSSLANAYKELLLNKDKWKQCQNAAIRRVERFYNFEKFLDNYRNVYKKAINGWNRI